jgi:endoglucanase
VLRGVGRRSRLVGRRHYWPSLASLSLFLACGLQGCRAQQPWPLWEAYTHSFLDDQGRVIDRSANDRTTSEGEAYAMFFALVDNDRSHFDKLLDWTQANLAAGDLTTHLPAWEWGKSSSGEWKTIDDNSASDADLWMAYTLLEAGRLWHEPRYEDLGRLMAARIAKDEVVLVPGLGTTVAPGSQGFHPETDKYILNPSYLPLPVLVRLARAMPQGPWSSVLASLPELLSQQLAHGYAMDWVAAGPDGVHPVAPPAEPSAGKREPQAAGSYDAIRVYLWLGIADPGTPGQRELLGALPGMAGYLKTAVTPPLEVDGQGNVVHAEAPVGFSAAVIPYLLATGAKAQARIQTDRLDAMRDPASSLYGRPVEYYDQNLVLFSTGWSEQRYRFERDGKLRIKWK